MSTIENFLRTPWVYWTLVVAYAGTILSIVGIIVSENRNPVKSLAWVTVLLMFPIGGIVLYVFFGRSIKNTRMISRRNRRRLRELTLPDAGEPDLRGWPAETRQQIQLARSLTGSTFYVGNDVEIFDGAEKFEALERDIASALSYINLQYYIFADVATGQRYEKPFFPQDARGRYRGLSVFQGGFPPFRYPHKLAQSPQTGGDRWGGRLYRRDEHC